jgi:hypothetical protein
MRRVHFSIAGLMAIMIPIALGLAALHEATQVWVNIVFNLVVAALLTATYKAKCQKGFSGVWWAGFASFGWAHLVLGLIGMPWGQHYGISPDLVTQEVTGRLASLLQPDNSAAAVQSWTAKFLVVHCVSSLLFGLLGGVLFGLFASRDRASEA